MRCDAMLMGHENERIPNVAGISATCRPDGRADACMHAWMGGWMDDRIWLWEWSVVHGPGSWRVPTYLGNGAVEGVSVSVGGASVR